MTNKLSSDAINEIIEWDVINWSSALSFWEKNTFHNFSDSFALEIGANNGGLSLWAAINGCRIVCSDVKGPTEVAAEKHSRFGVQDLIEYQSVDAMNISYDSVFNIVIFKSVLGGIGRNNRKDLQKVAIGEMFRILKPGGELFFAENLYSSPIHRFLRRYLVKWGKEWRYVTIEEMKEFTKAFSDLRYITVGFLGAFGRTEWQRKLLGKLDRILFNYITPSSWRYIIIGIARK